MSWGIPERSEQSWRSAERKAHGWEQTTAEDRETPREPEGGGLGGGGAQGSLPQKQSGYWLHCLFTFMGSPLMKAALGRIARECLVGVLSGGSVLEVCAHQIPPISPGKIL